MRMYNSDIIVKPAIVRVSEMAVLLFLLAAAVLGSRAEVTSFSVSGGETLRNVLLTSSGSLILGSNLTLRRLNGDLEVLQRTDDLPSDQVNRLLSGDPGGTYSDSFMSCTRTQCELLDVDDIESQRWAAAVLLDGTFNAHGLFVTGPDGISVFTAAMRNEQQVSRIQRGNLTGVNGGSPSFVGNARQSEIDRFRSREFLFVFEREGFSYYINRVTVPNGDENREEIRVVRLCNNDTSNDIFFASYFEIKLKCIAMGVTEQLVPTAATFLPSPNPFGVDSIVISVVDSSDSENDVCVYSLPEIHSLMTAKYDECRIGNGMAGLERNGQLQCTPFTPSQLQNPIMNECNLVSNLLPAQEVASPLTAEPAFSQSLTSGQFSSLLHSTMGGFNFIFAGTDSGKLHQYYIENSSSILLIHTFDLVDSSEVGVANITQLTVSSDDLTLYALTPHKLISHSIDVCDSYESCATCVGGGDPLCGWCSLESRCTREVDCAESAEWVYEDVGSCPMILSADPNIIYTDQLQSGLSVVLETANIPDGGRTYLCMHDFMNNASGQLTTSSTITMETSSSVATRIDDRFTCDVPTTVPPIPNMEDALLSILSLRHGGNDIATFSSPIRFADCSVHTSCTECIQTESRCSWCPFTFKCIRRDGDCGDAETPVSTSCPKLLPHETTFDYLLHTNYLYGENPLVIRAENVAEFTDLFAEGKFKCVISESGRELFTTGAELGGDNEVHCQQRQFDYVYTDDEETLNATLDVVWTTNNVAIDNPSGTGVTLYSCPRLGSNCARCLAVAPDYQCSYCFTQSMFSCSLNTLCSGASQTVSDVAECDFPVIDSISPTSGPIEGGTMVTVVGTNLGATRSNIESVLIDGVSCDIIDQLYQPGISITCVTEGVASSGSYPISIQFDYLSSAVISNAMFTFKTPEANSVTPVRGPQSGGTMVTISGRDLDIGSSQSVKLAGRNCNDVTVSSEGMELTCVSSESPELLDKAVSNVTVAIDNKKIVISGRTYEYVTDPEVTEIQPHTSFAAGGTEYIISGSNLHVVQEPRLLVHIGGARRRRRRQAQQTFRSEPCKPDQLGMTMSCMAPEIIPLSSQQSATIGVEMDGVTSLLRLALTVDIHPNPRFQTFSDRSFSSNKEIRLTVESEGSEFVFTESMVRVLLTPCGRDLCPCVEVTFLDSNTSFSCIVESTSGLSTSRDLTVTVMVGDYSQNVGTIKLTQPLNFVVIVAPIAGLFAIGMVVFVIVVLIFCYRARQKDHRYNQLIVEMEKLESSVARECKLGFAELQTDLDELTGDVSGIRLPYHDLQVYLLASLFPGSKDHPVLHNVQLPLQRQISSQRAIKDFHDLCMDKKVLLIFIRTLEEQRTFTIRDKALVGSLLMVALHTRLDYATEILKSLLTDLIHRAVSRSNPKLLLRRTESVAEKMFTNWLAFCLHGYVVEQAGKPLYLMYRAVKSQLEKGPIDVITGEARYSLSEHRLIRQKMDVEVLTVHVEADDGLKVPVKVLDCDTISQVKEKLLDAVYKATPVSKRPSLTSVDLEYLKSPREYMVLRDEDMSMASEVGWKKLNTLQHYGVVDGAAFRLMKRRSHAPPGRSFDYPASLISSHAVRNRAMSEAEDGTRVWHLFKQQDSEDPRRSPFLNKKMITEVYLPRMLSTKNILQKFVDDLFSSLFSVSQTPTSPVSYSQFFPQSPGTPAPNIYAPGSTVPMAVKYILDFLDEAAEGAQITETDVVHTWKNNALALRFWVNMIKNPEFVFDINKSHTVDACLSVIAQAFIDGCSFADVKLTIDSPTSKLLYNKDVQGYKVKVRQYYQSIARLPRVPEDAMQYYLKQLSEHQAQLFRKSGGFVVESALYELLRYGNKYHEQLLANLRAAGLESRAQVFESVMRATR